MNIQLTPHSVSQMMAGITDTKPVMQCIGVKPPTNSGGKWRIALSDGGQWVITTVASQLTEMLESQQIDIGTFVRLHEFMAQNMRVSGPSGPEGRYQRVVIILKLDVLGAGQRVNDPIQISTDLSGPDDTKFTNAIGGQQQQPSMYGNSTYGGAQQTGRPQNGGGGYGQNGGGGYGQNGGGGYGQNGGQQARPQQGGYGSNTYGNTGNNAGQANGGSIYGRPQYGQAQSNGGASATGGAYGAYGRQNQGNASYAQNNEQLAGGYGQAPSYRASGSAIARSEAPPKIVPIASLNAYQNRWTIKARVSSKSDMRRWSNAKGEGKFFTVDLLDAQGGEIRAIAFNEQAERFEPILETGAVVTISKASLKPKKPGSTYNQTKHDHEITLEKSTIIEVCEEDQETNAIPQVQYHFRKIEEIETIPAKTQLDVLGLVEVVDQAAEIPRRDGTQVNKRNITIRDDSNKSIEITLWDSHAVTPGNEIEARFAQGEKPILAIKGVRVGDFKGKTLSSIGNSLITINPEIEEAAQLRNWHDNQGGASMAPTKLSDNRGSGNASARRVPISAIKEESLGTSGGPAYVSVLSTISLVKQEQMMYPGCPLQYNSRTCAKKLSDPSGDERNWFCERCQQEAQPEWRYILSVQADDFSGHIWLTAFQEPGNDIIGKTASELRELERNNLAEFEAVMTNTMHKMFLFKIKVAEETWQDETRIKQNIVKVEPVDFVKESRVLLDYIGKIKRGEPEYAAATAPSPMGGQNQGGYGGGAYGGGEGGARGGWGGGGNTPGKYPQAHNASSNYGNQGGFGGGNAGGYGGGGFGKSSGGYGGGRMGGGGGYGQGGF